MFRTASTHFVGLKRKESLLLKIRSGSNGGNLSRSARAVHPWLLIPRCSSSSTDERSQMDRPFRNAHPQLALALAEDYDYDEVDLETDDNELATTSAAGSRPPSTNISSSPYPPPSSPEHDTSNKTPLRKTGGGAGGGGSHRCKCRDAQILLTEYFFVQSHPFNGICTPSRRPKMWIVSHLPAWGF
jgi:hypothetical protein